MTAASKPSVIAAQRSTTPRSSSTTRSRVSIKSQRNAPDVVSRCARARTLRRPMNSTCSPCTTRHVSARTAGDSKGTSRSRSARLGRDQYGERTPDTIWGGGTKVPDASTRYAAVTAGEIMLTALLPSGHTSSSRQHSGRCHHTNQIVRVWLGSTVPLGGGKTPSKGRPASRSAVLCRGRLALARSRLSPTTMHSILSVEYDSGARRKVSVTFMQVLPLNSSKS